MNIKDLIEAVKPYVQKDDKKSNKTYVIIGGILIVILLGWFLCRDNGLGINLLGQQFNLIGTQQSEITGGINNAKSGVENAQRATDNLQSEITESGAIIADCKRIIREVRERDESRKQAVKDAT